MEQNYDQNQYQYRNNYIPQGAPPAYYPDPRPLMPNPPPAPQYAPNPLPANNYPYPPQGANPYGPPPAPQPQRAAPKPRVPFTASVGEKIAAFLVPVLAYLYTVFFTAGEPNSKWWLFGITLGFLGIAELVLFHKKRSVESFFWLFCVLVTACGIAFGGNRVWDEFSFFVLHIFAGWYVFSRAGAQLEGETGALLPMDNANAFYAFPFKNFILEVRVMIAAFSDSAKDPGRGKKRAGAFLYTLLAVFTGLILFIIAVNLLMDADPAFEEAAEKVLRFLKIDDLEEIVLRLFFAIPIGMYLFGMIAGDGREKRERLSASSGRIRRAFSLMHKVPNLAYAIILGVFCAFYLCFFILQGSYLFGAFLGKLPEGFIVSEYARQGFFELCRVTALNFALLWIVTQTGSKPARNHLWTKALCIVLIVESMLFAAVAFAKLILYISSFGFTPLRLESSWLVCVLFFGCLCAMYSILSGKKSFRIFLLFAAMTFSVLCIY